LDDNDPVDGDALLCEYYWKVPPLELRPKESSSTIKTVNDSGRVGVGVDSASATSAASAARSRSEGKHHQSPSTQQRPTQQLPQQPVSSPSPQQQQQQQQQLFSRQEKQDVIHVFRKYPIKDKTVPNWFTDIDTHRFTDIDVNE
jgi:hypothetical protein